MLLTWINYEEVEVKILRFNKFFVIFVDLNFTVFHKKNYVFIYLFIETIDEVSTTVFFFFILRFVIKYNNPCWLCWPLCIHIV